MYYLLGGVTLSRLKFKNKYIKIIVMSLCLILPLGLGSIIYKLNSKVSEIEAIKIDEDDQIKQFLEIIIIKCYFMILIKRQGFGPMNMK